MQAMFWTSGKFKTRGPWALMLCLRTNLAIGKRSSSCTYTVFYPRVSTLSLFSLYGQQFPKYRQIIKITHIWVWNLALPKVPEVAHILSFYAYGVYSELNFPVQVVIFIKIRADFAIFGHGTWPFAKWLSEVAYTLFLRQRGRNWPYFRSTCNDFWDTGQFSKFAIFGQEAWPLRTDPKVAILSFCPNGSKFSLFLLYGQRFFRYGPFFKIAIFGHDEVGHIISFYPRGQDWAYFRSTASGFRDTGRFSK